MTSKKFLFSTVFVFLFTLSFFQFPHIASAAPAQVVARTGMPAVGVPGWTYNGLLTDNASTPAVLQAPVLAGNLVALFSSLRQGASAPVTDKGIWLLNQDGSGGRKAARVGESAPDTSPTTIFGTLSNLNTDSTGRSMFLAVLSGPDVINGNSRGMWEAGTQSTNLILREGTIAPETNPVGHFRSFSSGDNNRFLDGTAGAGADVLVDVVVSNLPGQPATLPTTYGVWARVGQVFERLYWTYGVHVDVPNAFIREAEGTFSVSGRGAYTARFEGSGIVTAVFNDVPVTNDWVLFRSGPGYEELIARTASPAPGTPAGVVFRVLSNSTALPAVNSVGDVVFWGMLAGPNINSGNWIGLWKSTESGVSLLARTGNPASAAGTGVVFVLPSANSTDGTLHLMDNSDTVFPTDLGGQGLNLGNNTGIYKISESGTHSLIARAGTAHSALPAGVTLVGTTLPQVMKAIGNDHAMFTAQFFGTGVTTANNDVLMRHTNAGGLQLIAREGEQIGNFILKSFVGNGTDLQLTDNYYAVVSATFSPASNPTATPQPGILGISPTGETSVLAVKGSPLELSDGTTPTINNFLISPKSALNEAGKVVFSVKFNPTAVRDEAAVVASIESDTPACSADFDQNGTVEVADIFAFLTAWFAQSPTADADENGQVQVQDIFTFLSTWFAGC